MKLPALVGRFPKPFWWRPDPDKRWPDDWPVFPKDADERYPQLVQDFRLWQNGLEQRFRRLDHDAQLLQHQFWWQQVTLILGGLVATVLGADQAAAGGGQKGVAAAQAALTGMLIGLTALCGGAAPSTATSQHGSRQSGSRASSSPSWGR